MEACSCATACRSPVRSSLVAFAAMVCVLGGFGCGSKRTEAPEPVAARGLAATPMPPMERVAGREQLLYRTEALATHGYGRGDLLGIFTKIEGELDAVGYGHVTQVKGQAIEFLATFLPDEHRANALWLGPLPDDEHMGHRIGKVLDSPDTGRFHIDLGQADGVRLGNTYLVFDGVITDANFDARTLQKRPVGLLQVVKVDDGKVVSLTVLRQGSAPRGAWIELVDADLRGGGLLDDRQKITVLILHLVDERIADGEDLQRQYWTKLRNVLRGKEVSLGKESLLRLAFAERKHALVDGDQWAIVEVGREFGADIVVWGSVECSSSEACVRPNVTFVSQEKFGDEALVWEKRIGSKTGLIGLNDDVGGVDQSIHGLASWLAGLGYFEAQAYKDAAYHLEQVPLDVDLVGEWMVAQNLLFSCYDAMGDWDKAEKVSLLLIELGKAIEVAEYEAQARVMLARILYNRRSYDESLEQAEQARGLAEVDGDTRTVADAWGQVGDILHDRGELDEALRIRKEKQLPIYEKLGDVHSAATTWGKIGDILSYRGQLDEALRIRKEKELPVYEKLGDVRSAVVTWAQVGAIRGTQGHLDEAISIYDTKVLPAYEALGARREVLVGRTELALFLITRNANGDRLRAESLLRMALKDAEAMQLAELPAILEIMIIQNFEVPTPH